MGRGVVRRLRLTYVWMRTVGRLSLDGAHGTTAP